MTFKKELLNRLLDKYEKSKSFNYSSNRRIMLKREEISQFVNFENYIEKEIFIREIKELKSTELIDFSWQKYEEDNLIDVIWLIITNVSESYKIVGRRNLKDVSKDIKEYLNEYIEDIKRNWIRDFFKDQIKYLDLKNKETKYLNFENYKDVTNALLFIDTNTDLLERVFSIKCFGNSKYFEKNVKSKIIRIIKDYLLKDLAEEYTDEEVLLEVGIYKYPEIFEFNGNIQIEIDGKVEQYYLINRGSYINSVATSLITKIEFHNIKRVLFIENKANYIDYIMKEQKEDELVIWHGGMYSPK